MTDGGSKFMTLSVLHIRKTAGTAVFKSLRKFKKAHDLALLGHKYKLSDVPVGQKVAFVVRHPVPRFVSGFNSNLRKGAPLRYVDWNKAERKAFRRFPTPNSLAEALSSDRESLVKKAQEAMNGIRHLKFHMSFWLDSIEYIQSRSSDIVLVLDQQSLDADFEHLKRIAGLPQDCVLVKDPVGAHFTPEGFDTKLSELGAANVAKWYADDVALYDACLRLREARLRDILSAPSQSSEAATA